MLSVLLQSLLLCVLLVPAAFLWRRYTSSFRRLSGPKSASFWRGNLGQVYARDGWGFHREIVERYGGAVKIHGLLGCHQVFVSDPMALHHMLVKDVSIYEETTWYTEGNMLVFGPGLLSTTGNHHRRQRKMLNPVFSIKNIRNLTPTFYSVLKKLESAIFFQLKEGPREIDMHMWMSRSALELIGTGGLGTSIDPLHPDPASITEYGKSIKNLIPCAFRLSMFRMFIPFFVKLGPPRFRRFLLEMSPSPNLKMVKETVDIMAETSDAIFKDKLRALQQGDEFVSHQVAEGKDVMSILLKANTAASSEDKLPDDELIAQMSTFLFAAHDTTSSALSHVLHCLAMHPEHQEYLRNEITTSGFLDNDGVSYDDLMSLPYLDAVCRETLRLHPPINFMARTARKDAILPLATPCKSEDGQSDIDHLYVRKGQNLIVAFGSVNRMKSIWGPDAYEWKPERWLKPLPTTVSEAHISGVYSSMMTFSAGSRSCVGFKYAELEIKLTVAMLLKSFRLELPENKTIVWNLGGIQTPTVRGMENQAPQLPLRISKL